jgi:copper chaperone
MATVQDIVLSVPDVSCEHCVKTVNGALGTLPGVETVGYSDEKCSSAL